MTISQLNVTGAGYTASGIGLPLTLAAGASTSFIVNFAPSATGAANGNVSVVGTASNSPTNVSITGSGVAAPLPQLSVNPSSANFGNLTVGSTGTQSIVLSNAGNANLTISQINTSGAGFTLNGGPLPLTLTPGQSSTYTAQFAPASVGSVSGQISFVSNASSNPTVSLSGSGVAAPTPQLSVSPATANFGNITVGSTGAQSISISNTGNASLTISQITTSGSGFSGSGTTLPLTLTAGQSANYSVQFAPLAAGGVSGQISFVSNAPSNPVVSLTGSGVAAPTPQLSVNPANANFGNVTVGSTGTQSISIINTGNASLTISQITTSGTGFSSSGITLPLTLTAGQSASYSVQFAPAAAGGVSGQISFVTNAPNNPTVSLTGTGIASTISLAVNPTSLAFGNVLVGSTGTLSGTLSASGGSVTISSGSVTGSDYVLSGLTFPVTLSVGQSASFTVTFTPISSSSTTGSIAFVSNASNSPTNVSMSGTGLATQLTASPTALVFGGVTVGKTSSLSETLSASGGSVTISSATLAGSGYSVSGLTLPMILAAGQSTTFSVAFAPTTTGSSAGSLTLVTNASTSPAPISISGTGALSHTVDLSWSASSSSVAGYNVYRGVASGGPYILINSALIAGTAFTDNTVQAGTTYFYVTTSVDTNAIESTYSNEVQAVIPTP